MTTEFAAYLFAHGFITLAAIITFVIRVEHRLTKLETTVDMIRKSQKPPC